MTNFFVNFFFPKQYNTIFLMIFFDNYLKNNTIQFFWRFFLTIISKTIQYNATLLIGKLEISFLFENNTIHSNELKFRFVFQKQYNTMQFFWLISFSKTIQYNPIFFTNFFVNFFFRKQYNTIFLKNFFEDFFFKTIQYNSTLLIGKLEI